MRGTFGEYCTRCMRTIKGCSFLSCSPATLPLIFCIHHLRQQPGRPATGLLKSLCPDQYWTYKAVPHFDMKDMVLDISCFVHGLWLDQTGHAGIIDSEHVSNIQKPGLSRWHYSLKKPEFVKVVLEYKPQESQTHLVLSTHLNPSELKHETYLSLRSTSNQTSVKPQPTNVRSHPKWDARLDTKNQRCEMLRLGIGAQLYWSR